MRETMLAALDDGTGKYILNDLPMPAMPEGYALMRVHQTGICGSDLHLTTDRSQKNESQTLPGGHEIAGEIIDMPTESNILKVGDRVAIEGIGAGKACFSCDYCNYGQWRHCEYKDEETGGGFAEFITRKPAGLFKIPDHMDWADAALVEPLAVSVHGFRYAGMKPDDVVGVVGSATIGLSSIVVAKEFGAREIIASARYPQQAEAAKKMGADVVTGSEPGEFEEACREANSGKGADFVVESIGGYQTESFNQAVSATRSQGTMLYLGGVKVPSVFDMFDPLLREIKIISSNCYGVIDGRHDFDVAIGILASISCPFRDIVTHTFALNDIQKGIDAAWDKTTGSIKVHISQG